MAKATDLTSRIHIVLEIDRPGPEMEQLAEGVQKVSVRIAEVNSIQNTYRTTVQSTTASVRYLLLNLRMFSFGIRTLRRQFGDTNPVMEAFSNGLLNLAAAGTILVSGTQILKGVIVTLGPIVSGLTFGLGALVGTAKILIGVLGGPVSVAVALLALIAIPVGIWALESASGISAMRREAKALKADLEMLETHLESLRMEQEKFNLGISVTQLRMRELKRAIDLAGGSNKALESQLAALSAEYENMAIAAMKADIEQKALTISIAEGKAESEDLDRKIRTTLPQLIGRSLHIERLIGSIRGITGGRPSTASLQAAAPERGPAGLGGIGRALSVIINFPGAIFNTEGDIEGALQSGAEKAGRIIYNQYNPPGAQR